MISHWHSDHILGSSELVKQCNQAIVYAPAALYNSEALHLAELYKPDPFSNSDKEIREFREIMRHLKALGEQNRFDLIHAKTCFFSGQFGAKLTALSPSAVATTQSIERIRELKPQPGSRRKRLAVPESENLNATALHFSFGEFSALLGSDLEETGNPNTGWSAVLSSGIYQALSLTRSTLYKVAHHGSETGHHPDIWTTLLEDSPQTIGTTFSKCHLPLEQDIQRITQHSSSLILTRNPTPKKNTKRDPITDRWMKAQTKRRSVINDKMGHIRIRIPVDGEISVEKNPVCVEYQQD